ncbi:alpha/beta fold hydrolase [Pontibacter sp. MBLB2868]|uniref:alpha/beta fold hydrolase n=1 Tax=Pontibacter sp. MBLB2868 TaxID=3451555 RepID=UPI003F74F709
MAAANKRMKNTAEVVLDSIRFEIVIYGNRQNHPVLFFHGLGSSAACIEPASDTLDQLGIYIIAINRPGTSKSDFFKPKSIFEYLAYVDRILEKFSIDKIIVIGWSAGGLYSQAFASKYPKKVESLHLISSAIPFYNLSSRKILPLKWKIISASNRILPSLSKRMFLSIARKLNKQPLELIKRSINSLPSVDKQVVEKPENYAVFTTAVKESYGEYGLGPYFDILALSAKTQIPLDQINTRTLIWHGSHDNLWPIEFANYLGSEIKGAETRIVENKGHFLYLDSIHQILKTAAYKDSQLPGLSLHDNDTVIRVGV